MQYMMQRHINIPFPSVYTGLIPQSPAKCGLDRTVCGQPQLRAAAVPDPAPAPSVKAAGLLREQCYMYQNSLNKWLCRLLHMLLRYVYSVLSFIYTTILWLPWIALMQLVNVAQITAIGHSFHLYTIIVRRNQRNLCVSQCKYLITSLLRGVE